MCSVAPLWPQNVPLTPDLDPGPFREHRVEVSSEHDIGPRVPADALAHHIAGAIGPDVLQAARLQHVQYDRGACPFAERWRWNFTQSHLIVDRCLLRSASGEHGSLNADARRLRVCELLRSGVALCHRNERNDQRQHRS